MIVFRYGLHRAETFTVIGLDMEWDMFAIWLLIWFLICSFEHVDSSKWLQNHTPGCQDEILEIKKGPNFGGKSFAKNASSPRLFQLSVLESLRRLYRQITSIHQSTCFHPALLQLIVQMCSWTLLTNARPLGFSIGPSTLFRGTDAVLKPRLLHELLSRPPANA